MDSPYPRASMIISTVRATVKLPHSSSGGSSSSMYFRRVILISVVSSPRSTSLTKYASTCTCTYFLVSNLHVYGGELGNKCFLLAVIPVVKAVRTISRAPRMIPQNILENHNSSWALPSSGSSTKSANGFSSKIRENCLLSFVQFATVGVMFRKILKPI